MHLTQSKINDVGKIQKLLVPKIMLTQTPLTNVWAKHGPHVGLATVVCQAMDIGHFSSLKVPTTPQNSE